ncbi:histidine kinase [Bacillus sp. SA1-12]|uniref:sensor histidine kinase n=1 Tax=Bacillus sp. SA1-12 TaxID=1455638 RepID=UPI000626546A|nr:HAMP domain-containing sensor histidine kinase [Bacillus sp. SA1-12]KKI91551.1 histidine kinase [Bacillus sp. SA1-12]
MKWKVTAHFLVFMVLSLLLSLFVFFTISILFLYSNIGRERILPYQNPGTYTVDFAEHIEVKNNQIVIPDENLNELEQGDVWIQVLDENGTELYSRFKPEHAPDHYTPAKLIHYHKFTGALEDSTIFVGMLRSGSRDLSYIMGFPEEVIGKTSLYYRSETLLWDAVIVFFVVVAVVMLIALLFGYFFSRRLAKPIVKIISGIQHLVKGDYRKEYEPAGIYQTVFLNLNELSSTLLSNEAERNKLEKIREDWVTNITHDIKTPLASIRGYTELIQNTDYELSKLERKKYTEIILDKSSYIERLIDDLNLTYKLNSASFPVAQKVEDLVEILRESVIQILNHPLYEETNLEFSAKIENYPSKCDKLLLQRAFMNIIYNAIVHNPPDTFIKISVKKEKNHVQIDIKDKGKGIPENEIENLFTRYYRGTNTGETHKGSGLGLAIAKQVIEAHGGEIAVESQLNEGTEVVIVL